MNRQEQMISPMTQPPVQPSPSGSGKATASLCLGAIGLFAWLLPIVGAPVTIIGLVLGIKGRRSPKRGLAAAGVILCLLGLIASIVNAAVGAYFGAKGQLPLVNEIIGEPSITPSNNIAPELHLSDQPYVNQTEKYSLRLPVGWEKTEEPGLFINPQPDTDQLGRSGNAAILVGLDVFVLTEGLNLDAYLVPVRQSVVVDLQEYDFTEDKPTTINGRPAHLLGGTFVMENVQLRNRQLFVPDEKGNVYVITATALASAWAKYEGLFKDVLESFKLLE